MHGKTVVTLAAGGAFAAIMVGMAFASPGKPLASKPNIGSFGFDETGMDRSVAPGDNFAEFAGGGWVKRTEIPSDKPSFGAFDTLADLSQLRTRALLEAAAKNPRSKIGRAYAAYLDTAAIDAKGIAPIQPWLARIKSLTSKADYVALAIEASRIGVAVPFGTGVSTDAKNPDSYVVSVRQAGLGMPNRDYYLSPDPKLQATKAAYQGHIARMFTLAGEPDAEARAKAVVDFETQVAQAHWTNVQSRDADKTYNKMSVAQLAELTPGFDFATYLKGVGTPTDTVVVGQPSAVAGIAKVIADAPVAVLRDQLLIRSLDEFASVLPSAFDKENFAFFGTQLRGTPQQALRWKRAVNWTSAAVTDEVSKIYVAKYFPPATKAAADTLVKNILAAMSARIDKLEWMAPETKAAARAKLANFTPRIGYPSQWRDYSALEIKAGDAFGNQLRANRWAHNYNVTKLGKPVYRWEWGLAPMTVNAQANPTLVAITFPAAILQPPFFDPKADPAVNYGGIGAVIGHEISHHFDDQGSKFDPKGRLATWWTPADVAAFKARTDRLVAQYDAYEPLPGFHVKGALTLGENTADLAGLAASLDAYYQSLGGKKPPVIGGYTGEQRFYLAYSQVWRRRHREEDLRNRLLTDPHSPAEQRVWTVRNIDAWYAAFNAKPGQKMYLPPEQRVRIW